MCRHKQFQHLLGMAWEERKRCVKLYPRVPTGVIVAGDFNLRSDTKTMHFIRDHPAFGHTGSHHLTNGAATRTSYYEGKEIEADHALASRLLRAKARVVQECVPSDHAALIITVTA